MAAFITCAIVIGVLLAKFTTMIFMGIKTCDFFDEMTNNIMIPPAVGILACLLYSKVFDFILLVTLKLLENLL